MGRLEEVGQNGSECWLSQVNMIKPLNDGKISFAWHLE